KGLYHLLFSPDGTHIYAVSEGVLSGYEATTGQAVFPPAAFKERRLKHLKWITSDRLHHLRPLLSPDARRLLLRGLLTAQVWDVATGSPVTGYLTLRDAVPSLGGLRAAAAFSPDGTFLLTADADSGDQPNGLARVWETATGKPISPLLVH